MTDPIVPPIAPQYPPPPLRDEGTIYVSRWAIETLGLQIYRLGAPADPDANNVVTSLYLTDPPGTVVFSGRLASRVDVGAFQVELQAADTQTPGYYSVRWDYAVDGVTQQYVTYIEIGHVSPMYDALGAEMKQVVEQVWIRFADLFDSVEGGPNLQDYFQTHFGRNRIAQLLGIAVNTINMWMQPTQTYSTGGGSRFPTGQWPGLLEQATYVETIKHLMRSYVEQPTPEGVSHSRLDRRDYLQRWQTILAMELEGPGGLNARIEQFKMAAMGLGRPKVLVQGGVFGNWGASYRTMPLSAAARPYYWRSVYN